MSSSQTFQYKSPLKYLLVGLCGLVIFGIFTVSIIKNDNLWLSIVLFIFAAAGLIMGIAFLLLFFKNNSKDGLIVGDDFIAFPGGKNKRVVLKFDAIVDIAEWTTYDTVIAIKTQDQTLYIQQSWMKKSDFETLKGTLQEYWFNK